MRLVEAAASEQDAALLLTAAFTGLRASELRALRWRSIDAANSLIDVGRGFTDEGGEDLPKSYRVRSVPMMPQVALALSKLRGREFFTDDDELVFASPTGSFLDYDQLARRYRSAQQRAGLRLLRFHGLRHSFGTMAVRQFPITDVQTWMGHADIATTRRYIHYAPQLSGSQPSSHVDLGFAAPPAGPGADKCARAVRTLRDAAPWCVQCVAVVGGVAATYEGSWHRGTRAMDSSGDGRGWSGGAAPVEVAGAGVAGAGRVGVRWSPFTRARTRYRTWM